MQKKLVYVGVLAIVAAAAIFMLSVAAQPTITGTAKQLVENFTVPMLRYNATPFATNGSEVYELFAETNMSSNVFIFNTTGFDAWQKATAGAPYNGLEAALSLEGRGALVIFSSVKSASIPAALSNTPEYLSNTINASSGVLPAGTYYAVVENMNGTKPNPAQLNVTLVYIYGISSRLPSQVGMLVSAGSIAAMALFVVGLLIVVVGAIRAGPPSAAASAITQEQVEALYKGVGNDKYKNRKSAKSTSRRKPGRR